MCEQDVLMMVRDDYRAIGLTVKREGDSVFHRRYGRAKGKRNGGHVERGFVPLYAVSD